MAAQREPNQVEILVALQQQQQHKRYLHDYNYVVGFERRISPLGLSILDNGRENEIRLQLYQSYK